jgi:hypothetical protein
MDTAVSYLNRGFLSLLNLIILIKAEAVIEHMARRIGGSLYEDAISTESILEIAIALWAAFAIYNFVKAFMANTAEKRMQQAHARYIHPRNEVR